MRLHQLIFICACVLAAISIKSCVAPIYPYSAVAPGTWRGVLYLDPNKSVAPGIQDRNTQGENLFDGNDVGVLPFLFDVIYENDTTWHIEIINGDERIPVKDIEYVRLKEDADMRLTMDFPIYDAHIEAEVREGAMQGNFVVRSKENYRIPFAAFHAQTNRFTLPANPTTPMDVDGKWKVTFNAGKESAYDAIGEFQQNGPNLKGTFRTETGDYRYLDGVVIDNKLWLSTFDVAHAFLFHAKQQPDGTLQGIFRSGKHYTSNWVAEKSDDFQLTNPDSLSAATMQTFSITRTNQDGIATTFPSESDHVKILQLTGTWCPNCKDETAFLVDYLKDNPDVQVEIAALAFERYKNEEDALKNLRRYREKMGIPYPMLYGGPVSKKAASESLPMIDEVISYPTMIILDKKNQIRKVHTGFNGPATSKFNVFKQSFDTFIRKLAEE